MLTVEPFHSELAILRYIYLYIYIFISYIIYEHLYIYISLNDVIFSDFTHTHTCTLWCVFHGRRRDSGVNDVNAPCKESSSFQSEILYTLVIVAGH